MMSNPFDDQTAPDADSGAEPGPGATSQGGWAPGLPELAPDTVEQEDGGKTLDDMVPTRGYHLTPIVGLGGSAGGIPALAEFFQAMPPDSGLVFVVVLHLSAEHESTLAAVLGRHTAMPVTQAEDGTTVAANHVYIIPPGKYLSSADGQLRLTPLQPEYGKRMAVDVFFRTLADTHGAHAAAVVLSGGDGDGASGLKRVKERGGLTVAQDPEEAEHEGMPRSAIETGMVDWVLKTREMPGRLLAYFQREQQVQLALEEVSSRREAPRPGPDANATVLRDVLNYLRTRTGRDFSYYKEATVLRRLARRMQINGTDTLPDYLTFLRTHAGESGALLQDLLISVTNFFRDREAFASLEARVPGLFRGKKPGEAVRVWVPACATGEEAYSVAMLLAEHAGTLNEPPPLQVFATDLAEEVVASAREGIYPSTITIDVNEDRLRRFFTKEHRGYRVRRELREIVLFAQHDLLKDSPFSRLDLVTCRNLLIYLNREAQRRALETFHFALRPGGELFLGTSETVEDASELFSPLDKKYRLYQHRPAPRTSVPVPAGESSLIRRLREKPPIPERVPLSTLLAPAPFPNVDRPPGAGHAPEPTRTPGELFLRVFEQFGPPAIIVDGHHNIVHLSGTAHRFLQFGVGEPTVNLLRAIHPLLRLELRAALFRAAQTGGEAESPGLPVELDGKMQTVCLRVQAAREVAPEHFLVVITPQSTAAVVATAAADPVAQQLEHELESVKSHLRDTTEQYEAAIEEQKAGNEELQAMNEELRSASEELETGREELQSINEELSTVNQELKSKVDALAHSNSDLQNLIGSTNIATVFLDRELRVTRYTPPAVDLFHLIPTDVGRPLTDLKRLLQYPEMEADAARVLADLTPIEREVGRAGDGWFLARLLPYRTAEDRIAGVVLTFVDISRRRQAETDLRQAHDRLARALAATHGGWGEWDWQTGEVRWSEGGQRVMGFENADESREVDGWLRRVHPEDRDHVRAVAARAVAGCEDFHLEYRVVRASGETRHLLSTGTVECDDAGQPRRTTGVFIDITDRKRGEEALRESEARFRTVSNVVPNLLFSTDADGKLLWCNQRWLAYTGQTPEQALGYGWADTLHPEDRDRVRQAFADAVASGVPFRSEHRLLGADGGARWFLAQAEPQRDEKGKVTQWFGAKSDIDDFQRASTELAASEERLRLAVEAAQAGTCDWNYLTGEMRWNAQRFRLYGLEPEPGRTVRVEEFHAAVHPEDRPGALARLTEGIKGADGEHAEEYRVVWPDGTVRWIAETGRVVERRADGFPTRVISVLFDVTESREAEEAVRASEERLRLATDAAHMYAWEIDLAAGTVRYSENAERVIGATPSTDFARALQDIHPEDRARVREAFQASKADHDRFDYEVRTFAPGGGVDWYQVSGMVVRDGAGEVRRAFGVSQHVTERKRAVETLRASEERFRLIFESARSIGIFTMDPRMRVTTWNPGAEQLFGWPAREIVGQSLHALMLPEDVEGGVAERFERAALAEGRCECEEWMRRRDGSRFWCSGVLSPLVVAGEVTGFLKILRDRTDELQAREAREYVERERARLLQVEQEARREAVEASAAKDHFLAVLSHELRTPLTPIIMGLGLLADRADLPPLVRNALEMIERNVELESRFIDDLLDMTRITRGQMEIVLEDMDLHEAARRAVEISAADVAAKGQQLSVDLAATNPRLRGDFARLQQAMWNLLKNASKFTPEGGSITLRSRNEGGTLCIEVTDTGLGLEAGASERIFKAFEQADGTIMRQYGGLGLGLAIAKATVDAHGGELSASSPGRNRGATFTICLPLVAEVGSAPAGS